MSDSQELDLFKGLAMVSGFFGDEVRITCDFQDVVDGGKLTLEVQVDFSVVERTGNFRSSDRDSLQSGRVVGEAGQGIFIRSGEDSHRTLIGQR